MPLSVVIQQTLPVPQSSIDLAAYGDAAAQQACAALSASLATDTLSCTGSTTAGPLVGGAAGSGRKLLQFFGAGSEATLSTAVTVSGLATDSMTEDDVQAAVETVTAAVTGTDGLQAILQAAVTDASVDIAAVSEQVRSTVLSGGLAP
jgi:hypothetical protein